MPDYRVFGHLLRSDLSFPEIEAAVEPGTEPDLVLIRESAGSPDPPLERTLAGTTTVGEDVEVRLFRERDGFLLRFADTGTFRITKGRITWWPGNEGESEAARVDVKGRVLPLALHLSGYLCLHAGAAATTHSVIAFVAPKRFGKSTLTAALAAQGAEFFTDDVLAISLDGTPRAHPGIDSFRLWEDSARHVPLRTAYREPGLGGKLNIRSAPAGRGHAAGGLPLAAIYGISPADPSKVREVDRRRLPESEAAMVLIGNIKNGELLGGPDRAALFERAAELAAAVPSYELRLPRDLGLLEASAARILSWHRPDLPDFTPEV